MTRIARDHVPVPRGTPCTSSSSSGRPSPSGPTASWISSRTFTEATRAEPGNLWFDWSKSLENDDEFILVEAFTDDGAEPHVTSEHFAQAMKDFPQALASTPKIVSRQVEGDGWGEMGEMQVDGDK